MKDVYEKNPQMGDPNSLQPKISETMSNIQKLRSEIHRNEVQKKRRLQKHILFRSKESVVGDSVTRNYILCGCIDRAGCLRWRESRAPEETGDTAQTTIIQLLTAERGKPLPSVLYLLSYDWNLKQPDGFNPLFYSLSKLSSPPGQEFYLTVPLWHLLY